MINFEFCLKLFLHTLNNILPSSWYSFRLSFPRYTILYYLFEFQDPNFPFLKIESCGLAPFESGWNFISESLETRFLTAFTFYRHLWIRFPQLNEGKPLSDQWVRSWYSCFTKIHISVNVALSSSWIVAFQMTRIISWKCRFKKIEVDDLKSFIMKQICTKLKLWKLPD